MVVTFPVVKSLRFDSVRSFAQLIPEGRKGQGINYGQGEGQFVIDDTLWGIYFDGNGNYLLQFEEGTLSAKQFLSLQIDILKQISKFTSSDSINIRGVVSDHIKK